MSKVRQWTNRTPIGHINEELEQVHGKRLFGWDDSSTFINITSTTPAALPDLSVEVTPAVDVTAMVILEAQVRVLAARTTTTTFNSMLLIRTLQNGSPLPRLIQAASNEAGFYLGGCAALNFVSLNAGETYTFTASGELLNTTGGGTWNIGAGARLAVIGVN